MKGFECVLEHWQHFYMRQGFCFAAPCCSAKPVNKNDTACQGLCFPSVSRAVDHLFDHHHEEVKIRKGVLQNASDAKPTRRWDRDEPANDSMGYRMPDFRDVAVKDDKSVAQQMVVGFMEAYLNRVGVPRIIGRKHWYSNANLTKVWVGFHLSRIDYTKKGWRRLTWTSWRCVRLTMPSG